MNWGSFALGVGLGLVVALHLTPANTDSCCTRFNDAARDKIAGYAGPFSSLVSGALDGLGITPHIASILDALGVPK